MILEGYFTSIMDAIEFVIALGSIMGLLGLVLGIVLFLVGSSRSRYYALRLIIVSAILIAFCGLHTGTKYFRI